VHTLSHTLFLSHTHSVTHSRTLFLSHTQVRVMDAGMVDFLCLAYPPALCAHAVLTFKYRGTSLIRKSLPLGPYSRTLPGTLWWKFMRGSPSLGLFGYLVMRQLRTAAVGQDFTSKGS
jgi:hypothetical protein